MTTPEVPAESTLLGIELDNASMLVGEGSFLAGDTEEARSNGSRYGNWTALSVFPSTPLVPPVVGSADRSFDTDSGGGVLLDVPLDVEFGHYSMLISADSDEERSRDGVVEGLGDFGDIKGGDQANDVAVVEEAEMVISEDNATDKRRKNEREGERYLFPRYPEGYDPQNGIAHLLGKLGEPDYSRLFRRSENVPPPPSPSNSGPIDHQSPAISIDEIDNPAPFDTSALAKVGFGFEADGYLGAIEEEEEVEQDLVDNLKVSDRSAKVEEDGNSRVFNLSTDSEIVDSSTPISKDNQPTPGYVGNIPQIQVECPEASLTDSAEYATNALERLRINKPNLEGKSSPFDIPFSLNPFPPLLTPVMPQTPNAYGSARSFVSYSGSSTDDAYAHGEYAQDPEANGERYCEALRRQAFEFPDCTPPKKTGLLRTLKRVGSRISLLGSSGSKAPSRRITSQAKLATDIEQLQISNTFAPPSPKPTFVTRTLAKRNSFPLLSLKAQTQESGSLNRRTIYSTAEPFRPIVTTTAMQKSPTKSNRQSTRPSILAGMPTSDERLKALIAKHPLPEGVRPPVKGQTARFSRQIPNYPGYQQSPRPQQTHYETMSTASSVPAASGYYPYYDMAPGGSLTPSSQGQGYRRSARERPPMQGAYHEPPVPIRMGHINDPNCPPESASTSNWNVEVPLPDAGVYLLESSVPQDLVYYHNWHRAQGKTTGVTNYIYSLGIVNGERARYMQRGDRCWEIARQAMFAEIEKLGLDDIMLDGRLWTDHYQPGVTQPVQSPEVYSDLLQNARDNT